MATEWQPEVIFIEVDFINNVQFCVILIMTYVIIRRV